MVSEGAGLRNEPTKASLMKGAKTGARFLPIKSSTERLQQCISRQDSASVRQRTDQPWAETDQPLAEPRAQRKISSYFSELGGLCVFAACPVEYSHGRGVSVVPVTEVHRASHLFLDSLKANSTENFKNLCLEFLHRFLVSHIDFYFVLLARSKTIRRGFPTRPS